MALQTQKLGRSSRAPRAVGLLLRRRKQAQIGPARRPLSLMSGLLKVRHLSSLVACCPHIHTCPRKLLLPRCLSCVRR